MEVEGLPHRDTRGILDPRRMSTVVDFHRYPAPPELSGLVDWFWSVRWSLPAGAVHRQQLVALPAVNVSVGPAPPPGDHPPPGPYPVAAKINGVVTELSSRTLVGDGWTIGAKVCTGAFGAWYGQTLRHLTNRIVPLDSVWAVDGASVAQEVATARDRQPDGPVAAAGVLADLLTVQLALADADRVAQAREVVVVAARAEVDREIRRVDELAEVSGLSIRTLQRMFGEFAGVSPKWLIRRFRLLEAAERARDGVFVDWAGTAAELGYADQSHLTREFTAAIGVPPAAYVARQV